MRGVDPFPPAAVRRGRGRWLIGVACVSLAIAGCQYLTPAYWECRRQWDRDRAQTRDLEQSRLTRRMIELGEQELRQAYLDVCMGRIEI